MNHETIPSILHGTLGIKKNGIALKQAREEPAGIEAYTDMNNICYMMAEALEEQKTFYTTLKNHVCTLGCAATGLDPVLAQMSNEERTASDQFHTSAINIFPSEEIQNRAEQQAAALFPKFQEEYRAVIIGPLGSVPDPDALVLFGTPEQIHLLTRAYCYATGSFIKGFAGMGACRMLLPRVIINKEPVFTISDRAWRRAFSLAPDELTLATPLDKLIIMLENLDQSQL
jgi:uncharacterized protein (DUF169 family)